MSSLEDARRVAIEGIRSILSAELLEGSLDLRGRIDIADPNGQVLAVVPYAEAIRIYLPEDGQ